MRVQPLGRRVPFLAVGPQRFHQLMTGMAVPVDQSGHHDLAMRVDRLAWPETPRQLRARADSGDPVADDRHRAVVDHAPGRIHGDHCTAGDENIGGLLPHCRNSAAGQRQAGADARHKPRDSDLFHALPLPS